MAKIVSRVVPTPGDTANIYSHSDLQVGQKIDVSHPTGSTTATVVHDYGKAGNHISHVHDNTQPGNTRTENMGTGYYQIQIDQD